MDKEKIECFTGDIVTEYVSLANEFTKDLSAALIDPMWILFIAFTGLWIVIQGLRLSVFQISIMDVSKDFMFIIIAAILLSGQGPELVNSIYSASLDMMGSASSIALSVGKQSSVIVPGSNGAVPLGEGMRTLVCTAEDGVTNVFSMATMIFASGGLTDPLPWAIAIVLALPYFLVLIVYFSQVVVAIFRIMMLATLSPFIMLGFGFSWGRDTSKTGIRTLISSFMVLFGATSALAVMLYGVAKLDIGGVLTEETARDLASIENPDLLLAIAMGWLGTAFMTEATGMANSISGSSLTNTSTGIITAGATATAMMLTKNPASAAILNAAKSAAGASGWAAAGIASNPGEALPRAGQAISSSASDLVARAKNYGKTE